MYLHPCLASPKTNANAVALLSLRLHDVSMQVYKGRKTIELTPFIIIIIIFLIIDRANRIRWRQQLAMGDMVRIRHCYYDCVVAE